MSRLLFVPGCIAIYLAFAFLLPPYFPLLQSDSAGYLGFYPNRTAFYPLFLWALTELGCNLHEITIIQALLFAAALAVLLVSLLRIGVPRWLIVLFTILLGANGYFSSFHRTIMTESLFFTGMVLEIAFLIEYLRSGRMGFLASAGLCVGFLIGLRPAGIAFLPMLLIAAWLKWRDRNASPAVLIIATVVALVIGPAAEWLGHRAVHGDERDSILPDILFGKAAMLIREGSTFSGRYAAELNSVGRDVQAAYAPVHEFLAKVPSLIAWPVLTAGYEVLAHMSLFQEELMEAMERSGATDAELRSALGIQTILANPMGFVRLTAIHYVGQWSITAMAFPPAAFAVDRFVEKYPEEVPYAHRLSPILLHPQPSLRSIVVYPAFLIAGIVSLGLSFLLLAFIFNRDLATRYPLLMLAAYFAATAHVYTLLVSLVNVSNPRFLMSVYPQILLAGLFAFMALQQGLRLPGAAGAGLKPAPYTGA